MKLDVVRAGTWARLLTIVSVFTVVDIGIFQVLDWVFPEVDKNIITNVGRGIFALVCLIFMVELAPGSLRIYQLPQMSLWAWGGMGFVFVFFLSPNYVHGDVPLEGVWRFLDVLLFSIMIGVAEETYCRGLAFHVFRKIGFWSAVHVSSIIFGLMHFFNLQGGSNPAYTVGQVINSAGFGYLAAGMMVLSGSIWIPILFHGLMDFPVVTIEDLGMGEISYSWMDIISLGTHSLAMISVGIVMIWARRGWPRFVLVLVEKVKAVALRLKLVETE